MLRVKIHKELDGFVLDTEWEAEKGEVISLFGPSGSGKSLTIQAIAGLITPDNGYIEIDKELMFHKQKNICVPSKARGVGYVPQNFGLFPHMKIGENIMFGMKDKDSSIKEKKMLELLRRVGLENKRERYPQQLSGGEKQRIAILRAFATNPRVLLLDEPFSAVDIPARKLLRSEVKEFFTQWNIPVVLVTHDPEDVKALATTIINYS